MSKATQAWGWKWLSEGHRRRWPYLVTRTLNDIGNYGIRGTVRERVIRGTGFWLRNNVVWKLALHKIHAHFRAKRGIPYKASELLYSQRARCRCGAGLAYWPAGFFLRQHPAGVMESHNWVCADILTGKVKAEPGIADVRGFSDLRGDPLKGQHDILPFMMYEVRSEDQPDRNGARRKVLWGLLGDRYATCREVGDSTRFPKEDSASCR